MDSHVKHEHDLFIKWVGHVNLNMIRTRLAPTHDLFINGLVVSGLQAVLDSITAKHKAKFCEARQGNLPCHVRQGGARMR